MEQRGSHPFTSPHQRPDGQPNCDAAISNTDSAYHNVQEHLQIACHITNQKFTPSATICHNHALPLFSTLRQLPLLRLHGPSSHLQHYSSASYSTSTSFPESRSSSGSTTCSSRLSPRQLQTLPRQHISEHVYRLAPTDAGYLSGQTCQSTA